MISFWGMFNVTEFTNTSEGLGCSKAHQNSCWDSFPEQCVQEALYITDFNLL